jgi:hypothetical protein
MKDIDKKRFAIAVGETAIAFSKDLTTEHISILWKILSEYEIEVIEIAFSDHLKTGKHFPVPADIINLIPKKRRQANKGDVILVEGKQLRLLN